MPDRYLEENRFLYIKSSLGPDELLLESFTGEEAISHLFSFQLELWSENAAIKFEDILGQAISFGVIGPEGGEPRHINGIVTSFAQLPGTFRLARYRATVSPKIWVLTRTQNLRIFQDKDVPDILKKVLQGFDVSWELHKSYPKREYCVQYRETDFNFISRLMEENGIFYYFEHEAGKHTMVIVDSLSSYEECPGQNRAGLSLEPGGADEDDVISSWSIEQSLRSGKYTLTDYNFKTPSTSLLATEPTIFSVGGNSNFELFDYPGDYTARADGSAFAKLRMQEVESRHVIARGSSVCRAFTSGYKFALVDHPQAAMNAEYLLVEIEHTASVSGTYSSSGNAGGPASYSNSFQCIPASVQFRPDRVIPKSFVQGLQ